MDVLNQLLSVENIVLCLAIVGLVWMQRKALELSFPKLKNKETKLGKWWHEFLIPLGPLGTGVLLTLVPAVPVPEMFAGGVINRGIFGIFLGLISGLVYRLVKKNFINKIGQEDPSNNTPYQQ